MGSAYSWNRQLKTHSEAAKASFYLNWFQHGRVRYSLHLCESAGAQPCDAHNGHPDGRHSFFNHPLYPSAMSETSSLQSMSAVHVTPRIKRQGEYKVQRLEPGERPSPHHRFTLALCGPCDLLPNREDRKNKFSSCSRYSPDHY